ncbi:hypothetical protein GOODEAATRI_001855 [Goodea atripinnis]|uniref:Uncharacterized protein n=1 Tax=Goodea atripinnis TaxID=208336 RepID=A0ABV0MH37_9TELE
MAKREERRQRRMKEALERQKQLDPTAVDAGDGVGLEKNSTEEERPSWRSRHYHQMSRGNLNPCSRFCLSRGSVRSPEVTAGDEQDDDARLEAERKLDELKRRRDGAESEEFERMRQKQQEAEVELEELKRKREERRKVLEEEERQRKQEEAERKAREEVRSFTRSTFSFFLLPTFNLHLSLFPLPLTSSLTLMYLYVSSFVSSCSPKWRCRWFSFYLLALRPPLSAVALTGRLC